MPRAIWTGAISFGMVTVPVRLFSAVNRKTVRFHQLSQKTGARIMQRRVDSVSGDEVPYEEIIKGYELAPDRYVVVEPAELDALAPEKTRTIDIEDFVELSQIDPIFYDHPYYLAPGQGGAKPYWLLVQTMRETEKVAIARVVIRSKEQLVALRAMDGVLEMATMLFADEVIDPERIEDMPAASEIKTNKRELEIARQLVESLAGDFEPKKYHDSYREQVLELIERKAQGEEIAVQPPEEEVPEAVPDLMSALKASLEAVRAHTAPDGAEAEAPAKKQRTRAASKTNAKTPGARKAPAARANGAKRSPSSAGARTKKPGAAKGSGRKPAASRASAKR
ncbi:MAG: Ku protein [Actinobacteria bacterium]|nr:MAG: Ku protein [Actinomycetota bacterium]